jgi:hypothetical protein
MITQYFDQYHYIHAEKNLPSENPLTFTALWRLYRPNHFFYPAKILDYLTKNPSHDEITGAIFLWSSLHLHPDHFHDKFWHIVRRNYWHGVFFFSDMIFYFNWLRRWWARPLLWVLSLVMILGCLPAVKFTPNIFVQIYYFLRYHMAGAEWSWIKTDKVYYIKHVTSFDAHGEIIGATYHNYALDGVQLNFLRLKALDMKRTERICEWILKKRFGEKYKWTIHYGYFLDSEHPIVRAAHDLYA